MINADTEMKLLRLNSYVNIMERELVEIPETEDKELPERVDDLRALVSSVQGIVQDMLQSGV